jgi:hypothetical protein
MELATTMTKNAGTAMEMAAAAVTRVAPAAMELASTMVLAVTTNTANAMELAA